MQRFILSVSLVILFSGSSVAGVLDHPADARYKAWLAQVTRKLHGELRDDKVRVAIVTERLDSADVRVRVGVAGPGPHYVIELEPTRIYPDLDGVGEIDTAGLVTECDRFDDDDTDRVGFLADYDTTLTPDRDANWILVTVGLQTGGKPVPESHLRRLAVPITSEPCYADAEFDIPQP
jgi:hypothetical protein